MVAALVRCGAAGPHRAKGDDPGDGGVEACVEREQSVPRRCGEHDARHRLAEHARRREAALWVAQPRAREVERAHRRERARARERARRDVHADKAYVLGRRMRLEWAVAEGGGECLTPSALEGRAARRHRSASVGPPAERVGMNAGRPLTRPRAEQSHAQVCRTTAVRPTGRRFRCSPAARVD